MWEDETPDLLILSMMAENVQPYGSQRKQIFQGVVMLTLIAM